MKKYLLSIAIVSVALTAGTSFAKDSIVIQKRMQEIANQGHQNTQEVRVMELEQEVERLRNIVNMLKNDDQH